MVSPSRATAKGGDLLHRTGRAACPAPALAGAGRARAGRKGFSHVLARYHPMGAIAHALRPAGGLHFQPAPLLPTTEQSLLDAPGFLSEPGRLLAEPGHANHALRLSTVLPGGQTDLGRGPGPAWPGQSPQD